MHTITNSTENMFLYQVLRKLESINALSMFETPEEFANVLVYLYSAEVSHITELSSQIDGEFVKSLL